MTGVQKPATNHVLEQLQATTPARIGVGRTGTRPLTSAWLNFRKDHALAKDAVKSEFAPSFLNWAREQDYPILRSSANDKADFICFPPKGKVTTVEELSGLPRDLDVQIIISDGLSARAVEANIPDLLPMLFDGFAQEKISCGRPVVVQYGRVAVGDQIAYALGMKLVINLIGERPGLSAADSLSAYMTYNPGPQTISSDRTVVSNIHSRGTLPVEAGAYVVQLAKRILELKASGVRLQQIS
jgi:ethanolamine ammonia-lyase small subunit